MQRKLYTLFFILLLTSLNFIHSETLLLKKLQQSYNPYLRLKDQKLTLKEKLHKWFPKHQIINVDKNYYLTTQYFQDTRADFIIKNDVTSRRTSVIPDTVCSYTDSTIVLNTKEIIPAYNLSKTDFKEIKNQIAWLTVLFRTLGTPVPELMLGNYDEIETYVIINNQDSRDRIIMPSFTETIKKINYHYENQNAYFEFKEIKKINSRLEFFGNMFIKNADNNNVDYIDIRFHTNRLNEIDLVMFIIHQDI